MESERDRQTDSERERGKEYEREAEEVGGKATGIEMSKNCGNCVPAVDVPAQERAKGK